MKLNLRQKRGLLKLLGGALGIGAAGAGYGIYKQKHPIKLKKTDYLDKFKGLPGIEEVGTTFNKKDNPFIIVKDGKDVGFITGTSAKNHKTGFASIYIKPEFRGKGYAPKSFDLLNKKTKWDELLLTINKKNTASRRAAQKAGFKLDPESDYYRKMGKLKNTDVRYVKKYASEQRQDLNNLDKLRKNKVKYLIAGSYPLKKRPNDIDNKGNPVWTKEEALRWKKDMGRAKDLKLLNKYKGR